jgi:hypothetical protein
MQHVIVITEPHAEENLKNILSLSMQDQLVASGVKKISDGSWLIDIHTSLAFFSALVHGATVEHMNVFVFSVDDIIHVPKDWKTEDQVLK